MTNISDMRQLYDRAHLDEEHAHKDAMQQFQQWFDEARAENILEPNAMILSTIGLDGNPESRTVLLKGLEADGFVFYTNYESNKAQEIEAHSHVSLLFLWKQMQRQVRISGIVERVSREKSESYFHSRPKGSQIGAWASPQSEVIESKEVLELKKHALIQKYKNAENLPLPDFWGGYILRPIKIEFWQGRPSRLHDRLRYQKSEGGWKIERLAP